MISQLILDTIKSIMVLRTLKISAGKYGFIGIAILLGILLLFVAFPGIAFACNEVSTESIEACTCDDDCTAHWCCLWGTCNNHVRCHCQPVETGNDQIYSFTNPEQKEEAYLEEPAIDQVEDTNNSTNAVPQYMAFPQLPTGLFLEYHCRNSLGSDDDPISL